MLKVSLNVSDLSNAIVDNTETDRSQERSNEASSVVSESFEVMQAHPAEAYSASGLVELWGRVILFTCD